MAKSSRGRDGQPRSTASRRYHGDLGSSIGWPLRRSNRARVWWHSSIHCAGATVAGLLRAERAKPCNTPPAGHRPEQAARGRHRGHPLARSPATQARTRWSSPTRAATTQLRQAVQRRASAGRARRELARPPGELAALGSRLDFTNAHHARELAQRVQCSVPHFCNEFKRHFASSAIEIRHPPAPLAHDRAAARPATIASATSRARSGYDDIHQFSKLFSKHLGCSPRTRRVRLAEAAGAAVCGRAAVQRLSAGQAAAWVFEQPARAGSDRRCAAGQASPPALPGCQQRRLACQGWDGSGPALPAAILAARHRLHCPPGKLGDVHQVDLRCAGKRSSVAGCCGIRQAREEVGQPSRRDQGAPGFEAAGTPRSAKVRTWKRWHRWRCCGARRRSDHDHVNLGEAVAQVAGGHRRSPARPGRIVGAARRGGEEAQGGRPPPPRQVDLHHRHALDRLVKRSTSLVTPPSPPPRMSTCSAAGPDAQAAGWTRHSE